MSVTEQIKAIPDGAFILTPVPHIHDWIENPYDIAFDGKTMRSLAESHERLLRYARFCSERLENVYNEPPNVDYLIATKAAIEEAEKLSDPRRTLIEQASKVGLHPTQPFTPPHPLRCSQCGLDIHSTPCGPTHAARRAIIEGVEGPNPSFGG